MAVGSLGADWSVHWDRLQVEELLVGRCEGGEDELLVLVAEGGQVVGLEAGEGRQRCEVRPRRHRPRLRPAYGRRLGSGRRSVATGVSVRARIVGATSIRRTCCRRRCRPGPGPGAEDQRDADGLVVERVAVALPAVLEELLAVVGGDDDERVVERRRASRAARRGRGARRCSGSRRRRARPRARGRAAPCRHGRRAESRSPRRHGARDSRGRTSCRRAAAGRSRSARPTCARRRRTAAAPAVACQRRASASTLLDQGRRGAGAVHRGSRDADGA